MALYKRPNSKYWWMKFTFDGELVQQSTKCANKRDALAVEGAYRHEFALGRIGIKPRPEAPTFERAVDNLLLWLKVEHSEAATTYQQYYYCYQSLKSYFGKVRVDRIKPADIEKYIIWRSHQTSKKTKKNITNKSVNFDLLLLKVIFKRLLDGGFLRDSPLKGIKRLSEAENSFHVLTEDEQRRYLLACPQPLSDVAAVMLETGMRCGEVFQLRRQDVQLDKGYLQVVKGKTRSSIRRVHLSDRAGEILSYRLNKFTGENLFPHRDVDGGNPTGSLNFMHLKTIASLGYSFRLYDCRHTFATRALENGVDLLTLASILGHSDLKMVSRYAHPSESHKAGAIKLMDTAKTKNKAKAV